MYIFQNDNFRSGNFRMKEKRHFPHEESIKWTYKFYIFNEFLNFFLENTQLKKMSFSFSQLERQEHVGGQHPFFKE